MVGTYDKLNMQLELMPFYPTFGYPLPSYSHCDDTFIQLYPT